MVQSFLPGVFFYKNEVVIIQSSWKICFDIFSNPNPNEYNIEHILT